MLTYHVRILTAHGNKEPHQLCRELYTTSQRLYAVYVLE